LDTLVLHWNIQWWHWFPMSQIPSLFLTESFTEANFQLIGACSIKPIETSL